VYDLGDNRWITNLNQVVLSKKKVMLSFDDGPGRYLPTILDTLQEKQVKAVFFWHSRLFYKERPWERVLREGHIIGSHAANHKNLTSLSKEKQYIHIKASLDKLEQIIGQKIQYFRPPFGQYNEETMGIIEELGLTPVMWDLTSYDWEYKHNPDCIKSNILDHLQDGSIILLHELRQTALILAELIDEIRNKGFEFDIL
jgi:peptidoglycan/xylan/chitin deacetylase (PgdA/CDA1 family)